METTSFGFAASLLFVGVPTIFLIGLFVSTSDGEKSSFYSDSSKGRLSPEPKK
ncbi:photosystem II reaction center protein PsbM [Prochlorococcus sp. MIT 0916]|jgi:photosystem II PsbM protein|uniref:photosystem II reaction center protein PsbM n=1 Tax=Prochlorococcus sp. MIT 0916 TaxID=3082521 RepID=UPI0039B3DF54|tara:strand:+ start:264 stop:422 length:159 start_codon:yes stop_codon:yes gene_type:complete